MRWSECLVKGQAMCRGGNRLPPERIKEEFRSQRVDTCTAVAWSSDSDESESEGVTTLAEPSMIAAGSDENENGSFRMFAENGENDGSGSEVVATVAEIDEDEIDEGRTFAESGEKSSSLS